MKVKMFETNSFSAVKIENDINAFIEANNIEIIQITSTDNKIILLYK